MRDRKEKKGIARSLSRVKRVESSALMALETALRFHRWFNSCTIDSDHPLNTPLTLCPVFVIK